MSANFNGHRQLWDVTCGGGPRSFKPYPVERDSVKQAREKQLKNLVSFTRTFQWKSSSQLTWDQALFSFRFENYIPAGKTKRKESLDAFHSTKIPVWNFGNFACSLNGTVHSGCTDPTQATARFVIVASQHTHHYALKLKSKYCLHPKEHSTVEKGRWKTKGGGILFRVESLWMQVKVKNSCELKRYVSQNIRTIRSNSWNCTVNKFGVLGNLYSARLCCIHFSSIDKLL